MKLCAYINALKKLIENGIFRLKLLERFCRNEFHDRVNSVQKCTFFVCVELKWTKMYSRMLVQNK